MYDGWTSSFAYVGFWRWSRPLRIMNKSVMENPFPILEKQSGSKVDSVQELCQDDQRAFGGKF